MSKRKIFFMIYHLKIGGTEKALIELIKHIDLDKFEVHVGVLFNEGEFRSLIPREVIIHEMPFYNKYKSYIEEAPLKFVKDEFKRGKIKDSLVLTIFYILNYLTKSSNVYLSRLMYKYISRRCPRIKEVFDIAVAYTTSKNIVETVVLDKIESKNKYAWIHFDPSKHFFNAFSKYNYHRFDKIFCVSRSSLQSFIQRWPHLSNNSEVFFNYIDSQEILRRSFEERGFEEQINHKIFLTVARFTAQKGQYEALEAAFELKNQGYKFKWYFIGDGNMLDKCKGKSEKLGLQDTVFFLGAKENPYPYMRTCNLYIQPSRYEGYGITLAEARIFGHPIVATKFSGSEQLEDLPNAFISGFSTESLVDTIIKAMNSSDIDPSAYPSYDYTPIQNLVGY